MQLWLFVKDSNSFNFPTLTSHPLLSTAKHANNIKLPSFATTSTLRSQSTTNESIDYQNKRTAENTKTVGNTIFILPQSAHQIQSIFGSYSPMGSPSILDAVEHIARKVKWFSDGTVDSEIILLDSDTMSDTLVKQKLLNANALIAMNVDIDEDLNYVHDIFNTRKSSGKGNLCQFALNSKSSLPVLVGPHDDSSPSLLSLLPWTSDASGKRMIEQMLGLFDRWTSDDFAVALMLFFNQYCGSIDWVKYSIDATWEKGPIQNTVEFYKMISKCGDCVTKCVADEKCKECLDALTAVDTRDQVASYRTIVSYESDLLRDFSFCILQKHNIFGCDATIPEMPVVKPMKSFRGNALTKEIAKRILVGHLDDPISMVETKSQISWKVAAGANVAYDQFPSQNQIFYEASNGKDMWYDPVFRVETIDGRNVWCKRHYRVREATEPGTFRFSVLDNGVTSSEFWNIVAVADDLSWIVFHYAGAATSVGQR